MTDSKNKFGLLKKEWIIVVGVVLLIGLAAALLCVNTLNSNQAGATQYPRVSFNGDYRIGDGEWSKVIEGEHISSTEGDVTLRGRFYLYAPDGEYLGPAFKETVIAFFIDHVRITVCEEGFAPHGMDLEQEQFGASACGRAWVGYFFKGDGEEPVEIIVQNPHRFGNETAVDELLANLSVWPGAEFERNVIAAEDTQRFVGMLFFVFAIVMLGISLFSTILHFKSAKIIWLMGLVALSSSGYFIYNTKGVFFWNESIPFNTTILVICVMLYMLFTLSIIIQLLDRTKKAASVILVVLGAVNALFFIAAIGSLIRIYDVLFYWAIVQTVVDLLLVFCLAIDFIHATGKKRLMFLFAALPLIAFQIDVIATDCGTWSGGAVSEFIFVLFFIIAIIMVWQIIPQNINASVKAKELETQRALLEAEKNAIELELKESRTSLMLSQIQPHFIYNTLGTIERMCLKDPQTAFELVRNFSLYLRGNFSELDSTVPIRFSEEIKHVQYYVNIERTRFPDMNIIYELRETDFVLPALSVQPLVENAIKHGLMRLETGGSVLIRSYETETHYCVEVTDDGAGFDVAAPIDSKKHVGLRNIRGRLRAMVNGELTVESELGKGTKATVKIPKEEML